MFREGQFLPKTLCFVSLNLKHLHLIYENVQIGEKYLESQYFTNFRLQNIRISRNFVHFWSKNDQKLGFSTVKIEYFSNKRS